MCEDGGQLLEDGVVLWGDVERTVSTHMWLAACSWRWLHQACFKTPGRDQSSRCCLILPDLTGPERTVTSSVISQMAALAGLQTAMASALWQPGSATLGVEEVFVHVPGAAWGSMCWGCLGM